MVEVFIADIVRGVGLVVAVGVVVVWRIVRRGGIFTNGFGVGSGIGVAVGVWSAVWITTIMGERESVVAVGVWSGVWIMMITSERESVVADGVLMRFISGFIVSRWSIVVGFSSMFVTRGFGVVVASICVFVVLVSILGGD